MAPPIKESRCTFVYGWEWEAFTDYVAYESQFTGKAPERIGRTSYRVHHAAHGYCGFTVEVNTYFVLLSPDGEVPPWDGMDPHRREPLLLDLAAKLPGKS